MVNYCMNCRKLKASVLYCVKGKLVCSTCKEILNRKNSTGSKRK